MQTLIERIQTEGIHVGGGIVKVDGFLNHQIDPQLMQQVGASFAAHFSELGISKVLTAEVSGVAPALTTAQALGVSMIYARKHRSSVMQDDYFHAEAFSRTKDEAVHLMVSKRYLSANERILLIDDFLATGSTLSALVNIVEQSGAQLCGIGCVIEKPQEQGREHFAQLGVPLVSLAKITFEGDTLNVYA